MNITSINSTAQPNFNGYIGKSITKSINKSANDAIKKELKRANRQGRPISTEFLTSIREKADKCIATLQEAVKNLHPDSNLSVKHDKYYDLYSLKLTNSKLKQQNIEIGNYENSKYPISIARRPEFTIYIFEKMIEKIKNNLEPANMKKTEEKLFKTFATEPVLFFPMRRAKKADKLAPEFGFTPKYIETLEKKRTAKKAAEQTKKLAKKQAKQAKIQAKKELKAAQQKVKKGNTKTAKDFMK